MILEANSELPKLNPRQSKEFIRIIFGGEEQKKDLMDQLTETQKKIQAHKNKKTEKNQEEELESMMEDWHIIEGQMMHFLGQPLSEMRKWPYRYFMQVYKDLAYCTGAKEYQKNRNSQKPDKKAFQKELGHLYDK